MTGYEADLLVSAITRQIDQHRENLAQWESGYLTPTEPDWNERRIVKAELRAAIFALEAVLKECQIQPVQQNSQ